MQATVGSHCLDCAKAARPDLQTRARYWSARQPALVTLGLISLNVAVFAYITILDPSSLLGRNVTLGQAQLGLFPAALEDHQSVVALPDGTFYVTDGSDWYRLVTSGFVHFGLVHLAFNMFLLFQLGNIIEPMIGRVRFLLVYLASLLGGSALELVIGGDGIAGGASGAVFGLMGLLAVAYALRGVNPLSTQLGGLLVMNLFLTFLFPNISVGGHIGGVIAGAVCGFAVAAPAHRNVPVWMSYMAPLVICGVSLAIAVTTVR